MSILDISIPTSPVKGVKVKYIIKIAKKIISCFIIDILRSNYESTKYPIK